MDVKLVTDEYDRMIVKFLSMIDGCYPKNQKEMANVFNAGAMSVIVMLHRMKVNGQPIDENLICDLESHMIIRAHEFLRES